jgi:hypothetical protein
MAAAADAPMEADAVSVNTVVDSRCFVCGCEADGTLVPECRKCGMVICRQHRDKNGFFNQYYTCFPCCRPEPQRVPWVVQAARAKEESARRKRAERARAARENGVGEDEDECLPVRGGNDAGDTLPVRVTGPRPPKLRQSVPGAPVVEKVASWQQDLKTPTPSCSPGAGRDAPGSTNVVELWAKGLAPPPPVTAPPSNALAPATRADGDDGGEEALPVRAQPSASRPPPLSDAARRLEMGGGAEPDDEDDFVDLGGPPRRAGGAESPRHDTAPPSPARDLLDAPAAEDEEHLPARSKRTYTFKRRE